MSWPRSDSPRDAAFCRTRRSGRDREKPISSRRHASGSGHDAAMRLRLRPVSACSLAILLAAIGGCSGDGGGAEEIDCAEETRDDEFVAGMIKTGDAWSFELVDAVPAPPDKGDNSWSLRVADGDAGVEGLLLAVTPFMPDDDHGTPIEPEVSDEGGGDYRVAPINLWMPGLWEVTVEASRAGETDSAVFTFCIQD
jgi:YtkA-like